MTSGPLHVSLEILLHAKHSKPMMHNSSLASKIRGMQRGIHVAVITEPGYNFLIRITSEF